MHTTALIYSSPSTEVGEFWSGREEASTTASCLQKNCPYGFSGMEGKPIRFIEDLQDFKKCYVEQKPLAWVKRNWDSSKWEDASGPSSFQE